MAERAASSSSAGRNGSEAGGGMSRKEHFFGFMYFMRSRRAAWESDRGSGAPCGSRTLDAALNEWNHMDESERSLWQEEMRRRISQKERDVYRMPSVSLSVKPKKPKVSRLEESLQPKSVSYLFSSSGRRSIRQHLYQKLLWRDEDNLAKSLGGKKFGLVSVQTDRHSDGKKSEEKCEMAAPIEMSICVMSLDKGIITMERFFICNGLPNGDGGVVSLESDEKCVDLKAMHRHVAEEMHDCWPGVLLVPLTQYNDVAKTFAWIKQEVGSVARNSGSSRGSTIRLDRLVCVEDMLWVVAHVLDVPHDDVDVDWGRGVDTYSEYACAMHTGAPHKCSCVTGNIAAEHYLGVLQQLVTSAKEQMECAKNPAPAPAPSLFVARQNPFLVSEPASTSTSVILQPENADSLSASTPDPFADEFTPSAEEIVKEWLNSSHCGIDSSSDI